jgi:citrate lyase beta subunit
VNYSVKNKLRDKKNLWVYQFVSLNQKPEKIVKIIEKLAKHSIFPVLDIEDSLEIPLDKVRTRELKSRARESLMTVLDLLVVKKVDYSLNIRVNSINSPEFIKDLRTLDKLKDRITWNAIFIPKVHSQSILKKYIEKLSSLKYNEIIIIIESFLGLNNLDEILDFASTHSVSKIQYGHWDYFYDIGEFPVPLHISQRFWEVASFLIKKAESAGFNYIHTPYSELTNHDVFNSIITLLINITSKQMGIATLSFPQGVYALNSKIEAKALEPKEIIYSERDKMNEALKIINFFEERERKDFSFIIEKKECRFYAPHEYLSAIKFLENNLEAKKIDIGIVGGCMASQLELGLSNLYHRRLSSRLRKEAKMESHTHIKVFSEYNKIEPLVYKITEKHGLDILILQIRPALYSKRTDFLIDNKRGRYILNPILLTPWKYDELEKITLLKNPLSPWDISLNKRKKAILKFSLANNYYIGKYLLLKWRAEKYVLKTIKRINRICISKKIKFLVIGPANPINELKVRLFGELDSLLARRLKKLNIFYIDIYDEIGLDKESYYLEDGFHLNQKGHKLIADNLYETIYRLYYD